MKKIATCFMIVLMTCSLVQAQQRITKKEVELCNKNLADNPLLSDKDADFQGNPPDQWSGESAVVLCQKTTFDFDKKGISAGKRIGRNIWGIIFAIPTFGTSLYYANANNETRILIEETERRKIILKDKFALDQYSILYFRLAAEGDAFAARVIKKSGGTQPVDIAEAVRVDDIRSVPSIYRSYTDDNFTSTYRPTYFKIAIADLEEGDIIEYEFRNFNSRAYYGSLNYKEFNPVYYLCNRELPVAKQVIEVVTQDDRYYIGYKSLKGAPDFVQSTDRGKKIFRWVDNNRAKMNDTRFVSEFMELPSVKFQVLYAKNNSRDYVWFKNEADMKREMSTEELAEKARTFWFNPEKLQKTGDYMAGMKTNVEATVSSMYKQLRKKGITDASDEEYARKAYYFIRSQTMYNNWSDFAFVRVFSWLLELRKIDHEIIVTAHNNRTNLNTLAFTQEIAWAVKLKNKYYYNPAEHLNPEELPATLAGNNVIRFHYNNEKAAPASEILPVTDTLENVMITQVTASLDGINMNVDRTIEAKGLAKEDLIDDVLSATPFMENDFRNYDGMGMFEGLDRRVEEKATSDFAEQKKEWKEKKPDMMKALAESDYGFKVEKYTNFRLQQDGRSFKKRSLKYNETFVLADMSAAAGTDQVVALPALIGRQSRIKKDERLRTLPVDVRYPRNRQWTITFNIPAGYTVKTEESLQQTISNECGSFTCTVRKENNQLILDAKQVFRARRFDAAQWPQVLSILEATYAYSQSKIILKKG